MNQAKQNRTHQAILEINLDALKHNLEVFRSHLKPSTKVMAMVKAFAYGSDPIAVSKHLEANGVEYLGVAYTDEGLAIRKAGVELPIMVMNPHRADFDDLFTFDIEAAAFGIHLLKDLASYAKEKRQSFPIHLKMDTGMNRLGFEKKDIPELIHLLNNNPLLKVKHIVTHLAASPEHEHDDFTQSQFDRFEEIYSLLTEGLGYRPQRHVLNTGGVVRFPQYQYDMVRLGIGLYGVDISHSLKNKIQIVNTFKGIISQIRTVKKEETIGYSRTGKANKLMRIGIVNLGYADGFLRKAGNGNYSVLIKGEKAPTVGNICMDMFMADLSNIPKAKEGDEVIIFGEGAPVENLAKCYGSIVYEVFTGISQRVVRKYI